MKPVLKLLCFSLVTLISGSAIPASAEAANGPYVSFGAGYNHLSHETINSIETSFGLHPGGKVKTDAGFAALTSLGWGFSNGIRVELEGSFRRNGINQMTSGALKNADASGNENKTTLFFNTLYDFEKVAFGIRPYIGVGIGYTRAKWHNVKAWDPHEDVSFNSSSSQVAYQGILGVSFLDNLLPGLLATVEYRNMFFDGGRSFNGQVDRSRIGSFPFTADVKRTHDQSVLLGVRYNFNAK